MRISASITLLILCFVNQNLFAFDLAAALADTQGIKVSGECERKVEPDRVSFVFTIEKLKDTVKDSTQAANEVNNQLISFIKKMKLKDLEISTTEYKTFPYQVYEKRKQVLKGYKTKIGIKIETSEMGRAGEILQSASKFQQENIQGPSPFVSDKTYAANYRECLKIASEDASQKALVLAKSLGVKLGKAFNVVESSKGGGYQPMRANFSYSEAMSKSAAPPQIEYAKQGIKLNLEISYKID